MTKVLFKRKTSDEIANLPVEDGAIIYNHETGATYLDYGNERIPTGGGMPTGDTFPIGAITSYAGDTAPVNWLICDGSAVSRTTYADLFDAIGTTYGVGDGSTTFNLPNLKGRVITGLDSTQTEFDTLGETGGEKAHTLTIDEMPRHKHEDINWATDTYHTSIDDGSGNGLYIENTAGCDYESGKFRTGYNGGSQPHNILQPYITLNYIIKAFQSSGTVANVTTTTTNSDTDTYSCNYINGIIESGSNSNGNYTKFLDGTLICRGFAGPLTTLARNGTQGTVNFPYPFIDTNYQVNIEIVDGQAYWGGINTNIDSRSTTAFTLAIWNNSDGNNSSQYFTYIAIGTWK